MIDFQVYGNAKPAGSKRAMVNKYTGKANVRDACKGSKDWKALVSLAAREHAPEELLDGPLYVSMTFWQLRPKSHSYTGKRAYLLRDDAPQFPTGKPDVLKLARAVEDALTGVIWRDDAQIVAELIRKEYGQVPGVNITIQRMEDLSNATA